MKKRLEKELKKISIRIYDLLEVFNSDRANIRQLNEDAVSSIILKDLARINTTKLSVKVKSLEVDEAKTGVDFDIWIGEDDSRYIRMLVQAKSFRNQNQTSGIKPPKFQ